MKVWKVINPTKFKVVKNMIKYLKKKKVHLSPWIENIYNQKKNNIKITKGKNLSVRVKVKNLGFKRPTELNKIYKKLKTTGLN